MKIRILKRNEKAYIELPSEMVGQEELELFQLKEGYYLLSMPLGQQSRAPPQAKSGLGDHEKLVLKKLLSIRFEKRTPAFVSKELSAQELEVLKELEKKGLVNVFRGDKYKDGVYNIRDSIYPILSGKEEAKGSVQPKTTAPSQTGQPYSDSFSLLNSRGYMIIQDKNEARMLSERLNSDMKSGAVVGVKGFDGKFYIVTRGYFTKAQETIGSVLKEDMDAPSIANAAKLEPDGCLAVLRLMAEAGEIIEKKRGIFAPI